MGIYDNCNLLELDELDGAKTDYLSLAETKLEEFKDIQTYKYVMRKGDRIDRVAKTLLGSTEHWKYILLVNPKYMDPTEIEVGDVINIPIVEEDDE
jgi:hypothetical protein